MDRYLSVSKMIEVEQASDRAGHTYPMMMGCAGRALADAMLNTYGFNIENPAVLGLVGPGNNGGDALVAMGHLLKLGWSCTAYMVSSRGSDPLVERFLENGGEVFSLVDDPEYHWLKNQLVWGDIILDGLLGTGIKLPLRPPMDEVLKIVGSSIRIVNTPQWVVAVDCPSGIDCDSGEVAEECLPADLTVCMAAVKQGLLKMPAYKYLGELVVGDIGLDPDLPVWADITQFVLNESWASDLIPVRPLNGHKGTFGTTLIVGGSIRYPGAPLLAGEAAFRVGAGWVEISIPQCLHPHLVVSFREATWLPLPDDGEMFTSYSSKPLLENISRADAILLGPGIGLGGGVRDFVEKLLPEIAVPLVLDADGLKITASLTNWPDRLPKRTILTPHPGEMSILTRLSVAEIQENRIEVAEEFARQWQQCVVLKGAFTVIADPDKKTAVLPIATPALARAGTGDVLAGMISGLMAQNMLPFDAACAGVWYHAQAGLRAAAERGSTAGVLAGDIVDLIPEVMPT